MLVRTNESWFVRMRCSGSYGELWFVWRDLVRMESSWFVWNQSGSYGMMTGSYECALVRMECVLVRTNQVLDVCRFVCTRSGTYSSRKTAEITQNQLNNDVMDAQMIEKVSKTI